MQVIVILKYLWVNYKNNIMENKGRMTAKLRLLKMIDSRIGLENFYSVTLTHYDISLQGNASKYLIKSLKEIYNIELILMPNVYIECRTKNIRICLTHD